MSEQTPNPQKDYLTGQAKWVKNCKLKKGDELVVLTTANSKQAGWGTAWLPGMDKTVGRVVQFQMADDQYGIVCHTYGMRYWFPFFVLAKR